MVQQLVKKIFGISYLLIGISTPWHIMSKPVGVGKKEVEQLIKNNKVRFVDYTTGLTRKWSWYKLGGQPVKIIARWYSEKEIFYSDAAEVFFENKPRVKQEAQAIGTQSRDIEYLQTLINCFKREGSRVKDLPKILHETNIENLPLSTDISPEKLKKCPGQLSILVKKGKISAQQYYRNVALNIFMKFLVDNGLLP